MVGKERGEIAAGEKNKNLDSAGKKAEEYT